MYKKKAGLPFISLLIVGVFFLSCLYMNISITLESGNNLRKAAIIADRNHMEAFQQQLSDGQLKLTGLADTVQLKHSISKNVEKCCSLLVQVTYLTTIFLISGVLYQEGKGRLFVCFITFVFHKARFLCELCIRKKKDGKKWALAF